MTDDIPNARIDYEVRDHIAYITFNRPERLNSLTLAQLHLLHETFRRFDRDEEAWIAIVSGEGRAFCSGADVKDRQLQTDPALKLTKGENPVHDNSNHGFFDHTINSKPVIVAAHGYAIGAGMLVLLEADFAIVTEDCQLQVTETRRGLYSSLHWLHIANFAGTRFANDVAMTGRMFSGKEAFEQGLVHKAVPAGEHVTAAEELAAQLMENPPLAIRHLVRTRRWYAYKQAIDVPLLKEGLDLVNSEDFHESALAFVEKRPHKPWKAQ